MKTNLNENINKNVNKNKNKNVNKNYGELFSFSNWFKDFDVFSLRVIKLFAANFNPVHEVFVKKEIVQFA
jgi:hypothetical protein